MLSVLTSITHTRWTCTDGVVSTRTGTSWPSSPKRGHWATESILFLVVIGDTVPHVDHLAHHYEIVEHLRAPGEFA